MALTPGGSPYVESSDLVANYPTVSLDVANKIDTKANSASPTFTGTVTIPNLNLLGWASYTPTISGTGWILGNSTLTGFFARQGRVIHYWIDFTFGSTATAGAGQLGFSTPVNRRTGTAFAGTGTSVDVSLSILYALHTRQTSAGTISVFATDPPTPQQLRAVQSGTPFTWATGDKIELVGTYEAAS